MGRFARLFACLSGVHVASGIQSLLLKSKDSRSALLANSSKPRVNQALADGIWIGKNGDLIRSGATKDVAPQVLTVGPSWDWQEPDFSVVSSTPLIDKDFNIYISARIGRVYKFDGQSGEIIWRYQAGVGISNPNALPSVPALLDGHIFNALENGTVFAVDMATGNLSWANHPCANTGMDSYSMTAGDGIVLFPCNKVPVLDAAGAVDQQGNSHVVALNATTGSVIWWFVTDTKTYNLMASIKDGNVYFEDSQGGIYCLKLADGSLVWKQPPPADSMFTTGGAMIGYNDIMYSTSNVKDDKGVPRGLVSAYNITDGTNLWRQQVEYEANNGPVVGHIAGQPEGSLSVVVAVGPNPDMPMPLGLEWAGPFVWKTKPSRGIALDAETGKVQWNFKFPDWYGAAAGDTFYKGHICLPDSFANPAIGGDGTSYLVGESGLAYAIRDIDGDGIISEAKGEVSQYNASNAFQASPAIASGMLAIAPCNGLAVFLSKDF